MLEDGGGVMRPLIFLDMDGVLCVDEEHNSSKLLENYAIGLDESPNYWTGLVDPEAAFNLKKLHEEFSPTYVISSSWATYLKKAQMLQVLCRTNLAYVANSLHAEWRTPRALSSTRRDEIEEWLQHNRLKFQPFIAIDDYQSGWALAHSPLALDGHVVLCNSSIGFTVVKLEAARRALSRQI
jgi:hypothetical protein